MAIKPYNDPRFGKVTFVKTRKKHVGRPVDLTDDGLQVTLSLETYKFDEQQIRDLICTELAHKRHRWERAGKMKIDENFAINYHLLKIRVRPHDGDRYSYVLEDDIWIALYPKTVDFGDDYIHARMEYLFYQILEAAGDHYLQTRGREIGDIIGTSIEEMKASNLDLNIWGHNLKQVVNVEGKKHWENFKIEISRELMIFPAEFVDSIIIHEFIHNFIWEHDEDFDSSCEYYCEKILGKTDNELDRIYSGRSYSIFAEKPFYRTKHSSPGPPVIWVNGRRLKKVEKDVVTKEYYYL